MLEVTQKNIEIILDDVFHVQDLIQLTDLLYLLLSEKISIVKVAHMRLLCSFMCILHLQVTYN